jgi:hypothetical protein
MEVAPAGLVVAVVAEGRFVVPGAVAAGAEVVAAGTAVDVAGSVETDPSGLEVGPDVSSGSAVIGASDVIAGSDVTPVSAGVMVEGASPVSTRSIHA